MRRPLVIRELATALAENCDQLKSEQRLDTGKNLRPPPAAAVGIARSCNSYRSRRVPNAAESVAGRDSLERDTARSIARHGSCFRLEVAGLRTRLPARSQQQYEVEIMDFSRSPLIPALRTACDATSACAVAVRAAPRP